MQKNSQVVILSGEAASRSEESAQSREFEPVRGRLLWSNKSPDEIKE
jgi:hypothetical protein